MQGHADTLPSHERDALADLIAERVALRLQRQLAGVEEKVERLLLAGVSQPGLLSVPQLLQPPQQNGAAAEPGSSLVAEEMPDVVSERLSHLLPRGKKRSERALLQGGSEISQIATITSLVLAPFSIDPVEQHASESSPEGTLERLVKSKLFDTMSLLMIISYVSGLILAVNRFASNPMEEQNLDPSILIKSMVFLSAVYFLLELILRLWAYGCFNLAQVDGIWFWVDASSVVGCWGDVLAFFGAIPFSDFLLVPRALRAARLFKYLQFVPDLKFMTRSMIRTVPTLMWASILLGFGLLISATFITQWMTALRIAQPEFRLNEDITRWFSSVELSMLSLFQAITGGVDWGDLYSVVALGGAAPALFFLVFLIFFQVTALNVLTSIFVNKGLEVVDETYADMGKKSSFPAKRDPVDVIEPVRSL